MVRVTPPDVHTALDRLGVGLGRYRWIQENLRTLDVTSNAIFQRRFNTFYRVRRGQTWRVCYYRLMEAAKTSGISFPEALDVLREDTGRIEASFASKLVATIHPSMPVVDSIVLGHFGLSLPYQKSPNRQIKVVELYERLCADYSQLIGTSTGALIMEQFDLRYPGRNVTALKKIDLVLWQIRRT